MGMTTRVSRVREESEVPGPFSCWALVGVMVGTASGARSG